MFTFSLNSFFLCLLVSVYSLALIPLETLGATDKLCRKAKKKVAELNFSTLISQVKSGAIDPGNLRIKWGIMNGKVFSVLKVGKETIGYSGLWGKGENRLAHQYVSINGKFRKSGVGSLFYLGIGYIANVEIKRILIPDLTNGKSGNVWSKLKDAGFTMVLGEERSTHSLSLDAYIDVAGKSTEVTKFWTRKIKKIDRLELEKDWQNYQMELELHQEMDSF